MKPYDASSVKPDNVWDVKPFIDTFMSVKNMIMV